MDVKNLIIDKYTNNVTTVDEISDTFPQFTKTEIEDALENLLRTSGAYMIYKDVISFVYKTEPEKHMSAIASDLKSLLQARIPQADAVIIDTYQYETLFPHRLRYKYVVAEISAKYYGEVLAMLRQKCFDVFAEECRKYASEHSVTEAPILVKRRAKRIDSADCTERALAYIIENFGLFDMRTQKRKLNLLTAAQSCYKINYSTLLGYIEPRNRKDVRRLLALTPEYIFLIKRMRTLFDKPYLAN